MSSSTRTLSFRTAAERLTHRFVIRRRLPPEFGRLPIYVSSEGGLKYLVKSVRDIDPPLLAAAERLVSPGSVVWDIGVNVGLFAAAASAKTGSTGRVIGFEPDDSLLRLLRRSAFSLAQLEIVPLAVGGSVGISEFVVASRSRATNHLAGYGSTQTGGVRERRLVPTVTLDWLAAHFPIPSLIKIDVEGAEVEVLEGGQRVLAHGPDLILEVREESAGKIQRLLKGLRYDVFDMSGRPVEGSLPRDIIATSRLRRGTGEAGGEQR